MKRGLSSSTPHHVVTLSFDLAIAGNNEQSLLDFYQPFSWRREQYGRVLTMYWTLTPAQAEAARVHALGGERHAWELLMAAEVDS